jgi:apolipoprotein N-acyltransferase
MSIFKFHLPLIGLSLLSAALFSISWQPISVVPALFFAFIPLLYVERTLRETGAGVGAVLAYAFLTFFVWNLGNTYWLLNATLEGALAAFVINTLMMCLPVLVYHITAKKTVASHAEWILITAWLTFEYLHHTWEFSWPWLSLGNAFAAYPMAVQWYEFSGVVGGSFWVLYANIKFYRLLVYWKENSQRINISRSLNLVFFIGFAPLFLSWYVLSNYKPNGIPITVAVVQPNIDPYTDKFEGMTAQQQTQRMLELAATVTDSNTRLVCFPETALQGGLDEGHLKFEPNVTAVQQFLQYHPHCVVLSGADSYRFYPTAQKTITARKYNEAYYYDAFNTALLIDKTDSVQVYHKAKLVPGVESMPYQQVFSFLGEAAINLGGTAGSLGRNDEAENFGIGQSQWIAPVICYESVFGEYVTEYVRKGAGLLCIVTNDGWWGNTAGYKQHFDYARLRAIETRRYIARSANTGISGFIDDKGNVISKTEWWTPTAQQTTLQYQRGETFYVKYAGYIELLPVLLFVMAFLRSRRAA